jgi:hypothetical protein
MFKKLYFFISVVLFIQGCNVVNPPEATPTYIHIDSFQLSPDSVRGTTSSNDINTVWVYFDQRLVGAFDLPCTVPIINKTGGVVSLQAGIAVGGLTNFQVSYPFYRPDTFSLSPAPGKVVVRKPTVALYQNAVVYTVSNFDIGSTNFSSVYGGLSIGLTSIDSERFNGNSSGVIRLRAPNDTTTEDVCVIPFEIPINRDAYLELNYKCDVPFYVGMRSNVSGANIMTYLSGIYPSNKWRKFYLSLKDFVAQYPGDNYSLFIKATLPAGSTKGKVLLDDIQVVHYN